MEIQEFKSRWNCQPIELISGAEADVLVNLDRERDERVRYVTEKVTAFGWQASKVIPVADGMYDRVRNLVMIGDDVVGKSVTTTTTVRSFAEFRTDYEAMMAELQRRVDDSDYVLGAIRSLGFDVREDTAVEKVSSVTISAMQTCMGVEFVTAFANTLAVVYLPLRPEERNVRFVAVAGAGWYKVTFAKR